MPTPTYDLIASNVLSSSASSVTFSSIPATYRDLIVVINAAGNVDVDVDFNDDTSGTCSRVFAEGNGTSTFSGSGSSTSRIGITANFQTRNVIIQVMDYSATDKHKTVLARYNGASLGAGMVAGRWASTSAVNKMNLVGSFTSGSTFYLYGIVS